MSGVTRRAVVHGDVQGVFFRASTRDLAREHGVTGWVRNDPEGTVTMHLHGEADAVSAVLAWVHRGGPPHARVEDVEITTPDEPADPAPDEFRIVH